MAKGGRKTKKAVGQKSEQSPAKVESENIKESVIDESENKKVTTNIAESEFDKLISVDSSEQKNESEENKSPEESEFDQLFNKSDNKITAPKKLVEMKKADNEFDKLLLDSEMTEKSNDKINETNKQNIESNTLVSEKSPVASECSQNHEQPNITEVTPVIQNTKKKTKVEKCKNLEDVIGELEKSKVKKRETPEFKKLDQVVKCLNCSFQSSFYNSLVRHSRLKHFSTAQQAQEFVCPAKSCIFSTDQRNKLRVHFKVQHPQKVPVRTILFQDPINDINKHEIKCPEPGCNFTADCPATFKVHVAKEHQKEPEVNDFISVLNKELETEKSNAENTTETTPIPNMETKELVKDQEPNKPFLKRKIENTSSQNTTMVEELETTLSKKRRNEILVEGNQGVKKPRLMEGKVGWPTSDGVGDNKSFQMKPLNIKIKKLSPQEMKHKRLSQQVVANRDDLETVLKAMYEDKEGHFWTKVYPSQDGLEVDPTSSVIHDLIEEHGKNCTSCKGNLKFDCIDLKKNDGSSILEMKERIRLLEDKLERLQHKMSSIDHLDKEQSSYYNLLTGVSKPQLLRKNEYTVKQGYRIIDLHVFRLALQAAQGCGHAGLMVAEANSPVAQEDLATQLALLCSTCGAQTIFTTSSFSAEDPPNYSVNKTLLPLLGPSAYFSLISQVQKSENSMLININMKASNRIQQKAKLIMSLDKKDYPGLHQTIGGNIEFDDIAAPGEQEYNILQQHGTSQSYKLTQEINKTVKIPDDANIQEQDDIITPDDTNIQEKEDIVIPEEINITDKNDEIIMKETNNQEKTNDQNSKENDEDEDEIRIISTTSLAPQTSTLADENIVEEEPGESTTDISETTHPMQSSSEAMPVLKPISGISKDTQGSNSILKLRAFTDLKNLSPVRKPTNSQSHPWNIAEERPTPPISTQQTHVMSIPAANSVLPNTPVQGGRVTPVAPGTKIVSSNVVQSSTSKSKLPPGVYRFNKNDGTEAVLIIKDDKELRKTPIIAPKEPSPSTLDHTYKTPLQIFSSEVSNAIKKKLPQLSYSEIQKIVIDRWTRMTDSEKQIYRDKAAKNTRNVAEPQGISLPSPGDPKPLFEDPSLPEGWQRKLIQRTLGVTAGKYDVYIFTPDGTKLRSGNELRTYLYDRGITDINPDSIDFSVYGNKDNGSQPKPAKKTITNNLGPAQVKSIKLTHTGNSAVATSNPNSEISRNISSVNQSNELGRIVHSTAGKKMVKMKLVGPNGEIKEILVPAIDGPNGTLKVAIPRQYSLPPKSSDTQQAAQSPVKSVPTLRTILPRVTQQETATNIGSFMEVQVKQTEDPLGSDDEVIIDDGDDEWRPGDE